MSFVFSSIGKSLLSRRLSVRRTRRSKGYRHQNQFEKPTISANGQESGDQQALKTKGFSAEWQKTASASCLYQESLLGNQDGFGLVGVVDQTENIYWLATY
jgi:hypothetical protein